MDAAQVEQRIAAAARAQHGVVTLEQLREAGLSAAAIARRVGAGRLRALHRGVYMAVPFPLSRTRQMAAVLGSGPGAVLSHVDAAALWGANLGRGAGAPVHVSARVKRAQRPGIRLHHVPDLQDGERTVRDSIPVTTPARTIVDVAALLATAELERIVAWAERERLVTAEQVLAILERRRRHRGVPALRMVLSAAGGRALTRSEAERRLLSLVRQARLPAPQCNVAFGPYEIDFLWPDAHLAVEVDGFGYHSTRARFENDRRKDAELLVAGVRVLRVTWRQITQEPFAIVALLAPALALTTART